MYTKPCFAAELAYTRPVSENGEYCAIKGYELKTIGIPNPFIVFLGIFPLYLFYNYVKYMGANLFSYGISSYLLFGFLLIVFVVAPIILLFFLRTIIIDNKELKIIYPFRLTIKSYLLKNFKSAYTEKVYGDSANPFGFYQIHLYFGQEQRLKIKSFEFINYKTVKSRIKEL